ncbi:MAG: NUDIX hydrolase, partial [Acidimicrobiales bacterium]
GYVESDESPSTAVVRETREETGIDIAVRDLAGVFYFDDDPRGNGTLIAYLCVVVGGVLLETDEAAEPTFFGADDIPQDDLAGAGHDQVIRSWVQRR